VSESWRTRGHDKNREPLPLPSALVSDTRHAPPHWRGHRALGSILRYDSKLLSYKIALLRAINDIVLAFPDVRSDRSAVAVPLRLIAEFWVAYYWPFVDPEAPIYQGPRSERAGLLRQDMAIRDSLCAVRMRWGKAIGSVRPSDGFFLVNEMRVARRAKTLAPDVVLAYSVAVKKIAQTVGKNPVRYAGNGEYGVFPPPIRFRDVGDAASSVPGTRPEDVCVLVSHELWESFEEMSVWVEALSIHQWCLFLEGVDQGTGLGADRGTVYSLLTDHPDNRRPLTWERNAVDLLMLEGVTFQCPWTGRSLARASAYDLDHIVPIVVYPVNELWNLVPSDPVFNQHTKRARLPSDAAFRGAETALERTYAIYDSSSTLGRAIHDDAAARFATPQPEGEEFATSLVMAVGRFVARIREGRNVSTFG
jgi:hypothetical protein